MNLILFYTTILQISEAAPKSSLYMKFPQNSQLIVIDIISRNFHLHNYSCLDTLDLQSPLLKCGVQSQTQYTKPCFLEIMHNIHLPSQIWTFTMSIRKLTIQNSLSVINLLVLTGCRCLINVQKIKMKIIKQVQRGSSQN